MTSEASEVLLIIVFMLLAVIISWFDGYMTAVSRYMLNRDSLGRFMRRVG